MTSTTFKTLKNVISQKLKKASEKLSNPKNLDIKEKTINDFVTAKEITDAAIKKTKIALKNIESEEIKARESVLKNKRLTKHEESKDNHKDL